MSFAPDHSAGGLQSGCAEKGIEPYTNFGTPACSGSLYPAKTSSVAIGYLHDDGDLEFFVTALKAFSRHSRNSKDGYALISPSVFDPGKVKDTKRGLGNIVYTRHLWLDFEDGDLAPEELAALFPNVRLVAMNSFHHRSDKPRFRAVFLPTGRSPKKPMNCFSIMSPGKSRRPNIASIERRRRGKGQALVFGRPDWTGQRERPRAYSICHHRLLTPPKASSSTSTGRSDKF